MERPSVNHGPPVLLRTTTVEFWDVPPSHTTPVLLRTTTVEFWDVPSHTTPNKSYVVQCYWFDQINGYVVTCNCNARTPACVHALDLVQLKEKNLREQI